MPLARAWMRGLSTASGAAVLVPGGIFAALLLLALAGSFGRIGGLSQAFTGPELSSVTPVASAPQRSGGGAPALLAVVASPAAIRTAPAVQSPGAAAGGGLVQRSPSIAGGGPPSGGAGGRPGGAPANPSTPAPPTGSGGCGSCAGPTAHQSLVDRVVNLGTSITSKLPGPIGQLTTQLLGQVGTTVDTILPTNRRANNAVTQLGSTLSRLKLP